MLATTLLSFPSDLLAIIVRGLTRDAAICLSHTSSASLAAVLESRSGSRHLHLSALISIMARLRFSAANQLPSRAYVRSMHAGWDCRLYASLHSIAAICAHHRATNARELAPTAEALSTVTRVRIYWPTREHRYPLADKFAVPYVLPAAMNALQ